VLADEAVDRDLLVSAQTGSGKTIAYGLAIAKNLLGSLERFERAAAPLALIVAPTRELALQVHRELAWLYQYADGRVVSCVGGMDPRREQRELAVGRSHRGRDARPIERSLAARPSRRLGIEDRRSRRG
jgi:ATP-dependent RNA helicase DeaD